MTRSNHFAIFVVIIIVILLGIGTWVTPVHANRTNIVTTTPTGTPIIDIDDLSKGEPVTRAQMAIFLARTFNLP